MTDETQFTTYLPERLTELQDVSRSDWVLLLAAYLEAVVEARQSGSLAMHNAAFSIVSAVSYGADDDLDAIGALAGELELASMPPSPDSERQWATLIRCIQDYEAKQQTG